jgi:hypothetical protein
MVTVGEYKVMCGRTAIVEKIEGCLATGKILSPDGGVLVHSWFVFTGSSTHAERHKTGSVSLDLIIE